MMFAQIILFLIFISLFLKTVLKWRKKELSLGEGFGWSLLWVLGFVLAVKPDTASYFAKILGIGRGVDLAIYTALIILFYLHFALMVRLEKVNRDITRLTREKALENKEEKL